MTQDTDQDVRDPVILPNDNQKGVTIDRLFPRLSAENIELWRQQDADQQAEYDRLRRQFEDEEAKGRF